MLTAVCLVPESPPETLLLAICRVLMTLRGYRAVVTPEKRPTPMKKNLLLSNLSQLISASPISVKIP